MKIPTSRRQSGFTLIELLVVIAIIAVLAAAGFAAGLAAIQKAKRTKALATCTALETAVNNFYTEYGSMPEDSSGDADPSPINTKTDIQFLNELLGTDSSTINTRKIKFLDVKEGKDKGSKGGIDGLVYDSSGTTVRGLFDPWGGPYFVQLDGNYDEQVKPKPSAPPPSSGYPTLHRRVVAWSNGADYEANGENGGNAGDDVRTW